MNLSQLQAECGRLLNDPSNTRWSIDVLTTRINLAQTEIQGLTNAIKTSENLALSVGISNVNLNASAMDIVFIYKQNINNEIKPLMGKTRQELDFMYPDWRQWQPGEPAFWFYEATNQRVFLVPAPDAYNANVITVYESLKPADLVNPTDIPFDSNNQMVPYHMAIVHWVVAQCWMDDGVPESLGKAKFHKSGDPMHPGQYELQLARIKSTFDVPEIIPGHILFQPQGGRIGQWFIPNKTNPFDF